MSDTFAVLVVCTGNICRSPMAERLLAEGLTARLGPDADRFLVSSAGTWGHEGAPMEPLALKALAEMGIDGSDFVARELTPVMVGGADLVLAATRDHRAASVTLHPRASRRAFTLREFARLVAAVDPAALPVGDPVERARALVQAAAGKRGMVPAPRAGDDDLADPYGAPARVFHECAGLIKEALAGPLALLAPAR